MPTTNNKMHSYAETSAPLLDNTLSLADLMSHWQRVKTCLCILYFYSSR